MLKFHDLSFGATSAVMTSLAIIIGLSSKLNAKINIITALLIIAVADNISDSFGIHIYQESQGVKPGEVKKTTTNNFIARFIITVIFILFTFLLPINLGVILSIIFGVLILISLSYYIAKDQKINPLGVTIRHMFLAILVMLASFILREITTFFAIRLV